MIEDTTLTELRLKPIDPEKVVSSEDGERAHFLETVTHGEYRNSGELMGKLSEITASAATLGFECDTECDFAPCELTTYNADKSENAGYSLGGHAPGEKNHPAECRFSPGEKVLCLIYEGYDAVFPGVVVGPLTEDYLRRLYEKDKEMQIGYSSADEAVESWLDWSWDSVIVRPLVRLKNEWTEMGETVMVNRVYVFPYKKFEI